MIFNSKFVNHRIMHKFEADKNSQSHDWQVTRQEQGYRGESIQARPRSRAVVQCVHWTGQ